MTNKELEQKLESYKNNEDLSENLKNISFEFCKDLNKSENLKEDLKYKIEVLMQKLLDFNLINDNNLKKILQGINLALTIEKEKEIYSLMDKKDEIKKQINSIHQSIKDELQLSFSEIKNCVQNLNFDDKDHIVGLLNDESLRDARLFFILKESVQMAFLNVLEEGKDVEILIKQISKNMSYKAITDTDFQKEKVLLIAKNIIDCACELANEGKIYAKELISGAIEGTKEGINDSLSKLKEEARFAPIELNLESKLNDFSRIKNDFSKLLKNLEEQNDGLSNEQIKEIIKESDSLFLRLKKQAKNLDFKHSINLVKQELEELETKATKKLEDIKTNGISKEAKKIADQAYQAAKKFIKGE